MIFHRGYTTFRKNNSVASSRRSLCLNTTRITKNLISERIRLLRGKETQENIATILDVKRARYNAWEHGLSEPSADMLINIAKHFNVTTDFLLGLSNVKQVLEKHHLKVEKTLRCFISSIHYRRNKEKKQFQCGK